MNRTGKRRKRRVKKYLTLATYEGQEAIANAIFQKLEELKYIQKEG